MSDRRGVSAHLGIPLAEYDARIRTFVPYYEEMLGELRRLVDIVSGPRPVILDLGIGTGALAAACRRVRPEARLIGIDHDPEVLSLARARLGTGGGVDLRAASFLDAALPGADLIVASLSLHHVPDPGVKRTLFARCRRALGDGGALLVADCFPPSREDLRSRGMDHWRRHLRKTYTAHEAEGFLEAWAEEDRYFPLAEELAWLDSAGFRPEVTWRRRLFGVILCL